MKQVKVLVANLSLEDRVEPHHVNDIVSLTDDQYARIPADAFGVEVADVASGGSGTPYAPPDVVTITVNPATGAVTSAQFVGRDGAAGTALSSNFDTLGVDWLKIKADGTGIYVRSNMRYDVFINCSSATGGFVNVATSGYSLFAASVQNFPGGYGPSPQCVLVGTPAGWETGGPASEPGFDALSIATHGDVGSLQIIVAPQLEPASPA